MKDFSQETRAAQFERVRESGLITMVDMMSTLDPDKWARWTFGHLTHNKSEEEV